MRYSYIQTFILIVLLIILSSLPLIFNLAEKTVSILLKNELEFKEQEFVIESLKPIKDQASGVFYEHDIEKVVIKDQDGITKVIHMVDIHNIEIGEKSILTEISEVFNDSQSIYDTKYRLTLSKEDYSLFSEEYALTFKKSLEK